MYFSTKRDQPEKITRMQLRAVDEEWGDFLGEESYISMTGKDGVKGVRIEGWLSTREEGKLGAEVAIGTGDGAVHFC